MKLILEKIFPFNEGKKHKNLKEKSRNILSKRQ